MRKCLKREMQEELMREVNVEIANTSKENEFDEMLIRAKRIAEINCELMEDLGMNPFVTFVFNDVAICNPFTDIEDDKDVNPVEYYGEAFLNSRFVKGV